MAPTTDGEPARSEQHAHPNAAPAVQDVERVGSRVASTAQGVERVGSGVVPTQRSALPTVTARPHRIAFAGTPADAVPALQALTVAGFDIPIVVTGAPRRRRRRGSDSPSPVASAAVELGLAISHDPADLANCGADCAVVVAFGQIISAELLAATPMLNLHFSLLPRWRGAAPVERALLAGDAETGVCLMALEPTLDTGPVYWQHKIAIADTDTADDLRRRLAHEGAEHLVSSLQDGLRTPTPQQGTPTYAKKITTVDREIDWTQPAAHIDRQIRVGGAWTTLNLASTAGSTTGSNTGLKAARLIIRQATPVPATHEAPPGSLIDAEVATGNGFLRLTEVQPAGRPPRSANDWLNGARLPPNLRLGTTP